MIHKKRQEAERQAELEKQRQEQKQRYSMISCPQCRRLVTSGSRFCSHCGSDMTRKTKKKVPPHLLCARTAIRLILLTAGFAFTAEELSRITVMKQNNKKKSSHTRHSGSAQYTMWLNG